MFIHLSSKSEKFSLEQNDTSVDLTWRIHFDINHFTHFRLVSFRTKPGKNVDWGKLVNISSNLVKSDVLNPRAYIYSTFALNKALFNEGNLILHKLKFILV